MSTTFHMTMADGSVRHIGHRWFGGHARGTVFTWSVDPSEVAHCVFVTGNNSAMIMTPERFFSEVCECATMEHDRREDNG